MSNKKHSNILLTLMWAAVIIGSAILLGTSVFLGDLNQDEGWYLYGARLVSQGKIPYRDFAFTQGPVMAYAYALATPLVKAFGLLGGRIMSAGLAVGAMLFTVLLTMRLAPMTKKSAAGLLALMLVGLNAYHAYFFSVVKTYSLTSALMMGGLLVLSGVDGRYRRLCAFVSAYLLVLAGAVRITACAVPAIAFLWLMVYAVRGRDSGKPVLSQLGVPFMFAVGGALAACAAFGPFLVTALDNMIFCMVRYHAGRETGGGISVLLLKCGSISRLVAAYFPAFVLFLIGLAAVMSGYGRRHDADMEERNTEVCRQMPGVLWICVAVMGVAHLMVPFPYDDYQVMVFPLFAAVLSVLLVGIIVRVSHGRTVSILVVIFFVSLGGVISSPVAQGWVVRGKDRLWVLRREQSPLRKLRETGSYIKAQVEPDTEILTQDIYLAMETGLMVPKGMEMGQFSYFPDMSDEDAAKRNVMNKRMLKHLLETCDAPIAAFSGYGLSVRCPEVLELSKEEQEELWEIINRRYTLLKEVNNFGQADTMLRILKTRNP